MNVETTTSKNGFAAASLLQLSHIHLNVETASEWLRVNIEYLLQLSHIHLNVETAPLISTAQLPALRFN